MDIDFLAVFWGFLGAYDIYNIFMIQNGFLFRIALRHSTSLFDIDDFILECFPWDFFDPKSQKKILWETRTPNVFGSSGSTIPRTAWGNRSEIILKARTAGL